MWGKRQNFDHINAIKAFLYTSVRNKCLNLLKHQVVIQKHEAFLIRGTKGSLEISLYQFPSHCTNSSLLLGDSTILLVGT